MREILLLADTSGLFKKRTQNGNLHEACEGDIEPQA